MLARGAIVGYKASVTIDASKLVCQTTFPNTVQSFIQAMQSKFLTAGLLVLNYNVKKAKGPKQFHCLFQLQLINQFPSKQAVVNLANSLVTNETGAVPRIGEDPCLYQATCGQLICSCTGAGFVQTTCGRIVNSCTGACYAPSLWSRIKSAFSPSGLLYSAPVGGILAAAVTPNAASQNAGAGAMAAGAANAGGVTNAVQMTGAAVSAGVAKVQAALPSTGVWLWLGVGLLGVALLFVFVYGKGRSL